MAALSTLLSNCYCFFFGDVIIFRVGEVKHMTTGNTIREIRTKKGMTQIQLAEAANIAVNSLRLYEQGKRYPKQATLQKISDALGVPASALRPDFTELWEDTAFAHKQEESRYMRELRNISSELIEAEASLFYYVLVTKLNQAGRNELFRLLFELANDPRYRHDNSQATDNSEELPTSE